MQIIINICKKIFHFYFSIRITNNLFHGLMVQLLLFPAVLKYYQNFLLVILCKYDLGLIRFSIAKWLSCGLLLLSIMEVSYGYVHLSHNFNSFLTNFWDNGYLDVTDIFNSFFNNFWSLKEPALPKDLHVLTYNTVEPTKTVEIIGTVDDPEVVPIVKRPYCVYVGAFLVLYWGVCMVGSGAY